MDLSIGLPALKDGDTWYRGYSSIKSYLTKRNDIDVSLSTALKADIVAWGSLVEDVGDMLTVLDCFFILTYDSGIHYSSPDKIILA